MAGRIEFTLKPNGTGGEGAAVAVDGKPLPEWGFYIQALPTGLP